MAHDNDVTRRDFVKAASAVSAVAAALPAAKGAPFIQKVHAANDQVQYGFIGTGSRGTYLLKHLHETDAGRCVAVCDNWDVNLKVPPGAAPAHCARVDPLHGRAQ